MSIAIPVCDQPISVPVDALSSEGFHRWASSSEFPRQAKITLGNEGLMIEGAVAEARGLEFAFLLPFSASTAAGFSRWATSDEFPERGRLSFLQQEILIDMSPEELYKHNVVKKELSRSIENFLREADLGVLFVEGTLVRHDDAELSTEPDALFATWETLQSDRRERLQRRDHDDEYTELLGTPDWVLEIVSRSSVRKDKRMLRELYHRAHIPEYWLIDALGEEVDFQILIHQSEGYVVAPVKDGWSHSPVFGRSFRLQRSRDRLGDWQYTLEIAPV